MRLTWKDNIVDVLDSSLNTIETMLMFDGVNEGWGITRNNDMLYVSNGSETIYKINALTFESEGSFQVTMPNGKKVRRINELEFVDGLIFGNIFTTNIVVGFDANNGKVTKQIDFSSLLETEKNFNFKTNNRMRGWDYSNNVLNGIAYDSNSGDLFLTGKRWSLLFRVRLI